MGRRESWNKYFMQIAELVPSRSTCIRRQVGAVAVDADHNVLATGYNGPPRGYAHCTEETCIRTVLNIPSGERAELCVAVHAEQNLVCHLGMGLKGATVYCTHQPCVVCMKLLMSCQVDKIIWKNPYPDELSRKLMEFYGTLDKTEEGYEQLTRKKLG